MKKLLALLLFLAAPAFGATVALSTGPSCDYKDITFTSNGSAVVNCVQVGTVTPLPPPVTPPPPPPPISVSYPGPDMWQYQYRRLATGDMGVGQKKAGGFTVQPGDVGKTVELGISGANLAVYVDGATYAGPFPALAGNHLIEIQAVNQSANGSIDLYHY